MKTTALQYVAFIMLLNFVFCNGYAEETGTNTMPEATSTWTDSNPVTSSAGDMKTPKKKRGHGKRRRLSFDDVRRECRAEIMSYGNAMRKCEEGQFYYADLQTCSSCDKYCLSTNEVGSICGIECRWYYNRVEQQKENAVLNRMIRNCNIVIGVLGGLVVITTVLLVVVLCKVTPMTKRMKVIEKKLRKVPTGDENEGATTESAEELLKTIRQESGEDAADTA